MGAPRRAMVVLGVVCFVIVGFVGGCVVIITKFEDSFGGPCGRDFSASPRPVIRGSQLDAYEKRNLALLDRFAITFGSPHTVERRLTHQCQDNIDNGAVVGITSLVFYDIPAGASRCAVVERIESILAADGWTYQSLETTDPAGPGFVGATTAWKDAALLSLSVQPDQHRIFVAVDHAGGAAPTIVPPSMDCH